MDTFSWYRAVLAIQAQVMCNDFESEYTFKLFSIVLRKIIFGYLPSSDWVKIEDAVVSVSVPVVVYPHVSSNTEKISIPHSSGDSHTVSNVTTLGQSLVQCHTQEINTVVKCPDEEIHLDLL